MSYLVRRRDGSFEIRESVTTPRGPRARTLATFRVLRPEHLDQAEARAARPFDRAALLTRADALGIERAPSETNGLARDLLGHMAHGHLPAPALAGALRDRLEECAGSQPVPDSVAPALVWVGVPANRRGRVLAELLALADRVPFPARRAGALGFPRLVPADRRPRR